MSLLRDMVGPHGLGRQAEHLLTGGPGGPIVPPPLSATRPPGRSATGGGANAGYPARSPADPRPYGPGPGHAANGRFVTPTDGTGAGAARVERAGVAPLGVYQNLTGARTAGLGPIVNAGAAPWRLPGFHPGGGRPMMPLPPPGAGGMWRPPPGSYIAGPPGSVPGGPAGRGIPLAQLQAHQQMLVAQQQQMRPQQQRGALPPGYRPVPTLGMAQYPAGGPMRPSMPGQLPAGPQHGATGAPSQTGLPQQQQQQHQHMQQHAVGQGAPNGIAAVSQGQAVPHYLPAPGYLPNPQQSRPQQQLGLLPPLALPLHRPQVPGMPAAQFSGSVQAQGAWRPSPSFAAQPGPQLLPPTSAAPPQQQPGQTNSLRRQFPSHAAAPHQGAPDHLQNFSAAPEPTVTFAAEPMGVSAPVMQQSSTDEVSAAKPSVTMPSGPGPAQSPAAAQNSSDHAIRAAAVEQADGMVAGTAEGLHAHHGVNQQQPVQVAATSSAMPVVVDPLLA